MNETDLPALDAVVAEAICIEHRRSIMEIAKTLHMAGWLPSEIIWACDNWSWPQLARAVGWERGRRGEPLVATVLNRALKTPLRRTPKILPRVE